MGQWEVWHTLKHSTSKSSIRILFIHSIVYSISVHTICFSAPSSVAPLYEIRFFSLFFSTTFFFLFSLHFPSQFLFSLFPILVLFDKSWNVLYILMLFKFEMEISEVDYTKHLHTKDYRNCLTWIIYFAMCYKHRDFRPLKRFWCHNSNYLRANKIDRVKLLNFVIFLLIILWIARLESETMPARALRLAFK